MVAPDPAVEFDGDAYLAALTLPTLKLGGRVYTGRLLGFEEYLAFRERLTGPAAGIAGDSLVSPQKFSRLVRDLTTAIFGRGRPWWMLWRPTLAAQLVALPFPLQVEALKSFSQSQAAKFATDAERLTNRPGTPATTTP